MLIQGSKTVARPRAQVWAALHDPVFLLRVIPGCTAVHAPSADVLDVSLTAAVGPIRTGFDLQLQVSEIEALVAYELRGKGSAGPAGSASGAVRVDLSDVEGGTLLRYSATTELGGRIAQLGARMVDAAARRFSEEFFANVTRTLGGAAAAPGEAESKGVVSVAAPAPALQPDFSTALSGLAWKLFAACFGGTFAGALAVSLVLR
jgi:carbon monoxide dehydrogenase subunit G